VSDNRERFWRLSERKRALLASRNPLSFAQQRLWFLQQLEPASAVYNLAEAVRLEGSLDRAALAFSLATIVARHEPLRTVFPDVDGQPLQLVLAPAPFTLPMADLRGLPAPRRAEEVRRLVDDSPSRPFDLGARPPLRLTLLAVEQRLHLLLVAMHHIVSDAWSMGVLMRELGALYAARTAGGAARLPELPLSYLDFARWQRQWMGGAAMASQLAFWKESLAALPPLELPADRPRGGVRDSRGAQRTRRLPPALVARLAALGRARGATPFMVLLAAFEALLHRHTGQRDFPVGSPIANRNRAETEGLLGFFVNTLVLRADLAGDPTFDQLMDRVRDGALLAYRNQDLPFERLVEELQPVRDLARTPLFQVAFALLDVRLPELRLAGLRLALERAAARTARFDLLLLAHLDGELAVEYSAGLFDAPTILRLLGQLESLLAAAAGGAALPLAHLPLLGAAERHQLEVEWNDTAGPFPEHLCLHQLFEEQAARQPAAVAVAGAGTPWTYGQLERRAERLACLLSELGVGPGVFVGVRLPRGPEMVRAVLAILKAGGAYLPIERGLPLARVRTMLAALGVRHLVSDHASLLRLEDPAEPPLAVEHLLSLADGEPNAASPARGRRLWCRREIEQRPPSPRRRRRSDPGDVAYVIFTSGSTGVPKGVVLRHRPVVNAVSWVNRTFGLGPGDRGLFIASLGFDLSVYDIFGLLAAGGTVHVATEDDLAEPARLVELLCGQPITFWDSAPAALQQLVPFFPPPERGAAARLRLVFLSGDWVPVSLPDEVRRAFPGARVVALGGATEAAIWSNFHPVEEVDPQAPSIPYGRPIRNAAYRVLDAELAACPIGVPGDLYIGGRCLAVGYAGDASLTAAKFLPDPWTGGPGGRLYRTGDRARWRPDGTLQFLGRLDQQVKIRGFRVELGEIEAALREHPAVRQAVAVVREDRPGDRRLVAYVVAEAGRPAPGTAELQEMLRRRLPEHMVPAACVPIERLPATANGKLDRLGLPAPEAAPDRPRLAPRDAREAALLALWQEVLGRDDVGVEEDFFELGGHSLIAAQLVARIRRQLGVELPLRVLFEAPTVARLAAAIATGAAALPPAGGERGLPLLIPAPAERHEPFPLSDVQQAYWLGRTGLFELGGVASHAYSEVDVEALDLGRLELAVRRLVERHDMLRAVVLPDGRQRVLAEVAAWRLEAETAGAPAVPEARLAEIRERMSHQVLAAGEWPLFALRVSRLAGGRMRLHFSLDALIGDAYSFNILSRELAALYADPAAALPPLGLAYRDYVLAEAALARSPLWEEALRYWEARLGELPAAPELPLAASPSSLARPRFGRRAGRLPAAAWGRLKARGAGCGLTPSGLVAAAFAEVLAAWSKSPRFTLNVTLFNRLPLHPEVDRIVGDFTSLLLLEIDAHGAETFTGRARRLQAQLWQDMDHRYVSGIEVLRRLARARRLPPGALMPVVLTSTLTLPAGAQAGGEPPWGARPVYGISQTPQVWLDHQVGEAAGALVFNWDAVEDLFPAGLLDALFAAYQELLARLAEDDETWHRRRLELLPAAQLDLLAAANATGEPVPGGLLHGGFEEQARRRPERLAVIAGDTALTYGELLRRSRAQARHLARLGAGRDRLVAVVMEKGWEQVVAVLGVLQAGAAYLPLSAELPRERLWQLLARGEAELVLTQPHLAAALDWPATVRCLTVEAAEPAEPEATEEAEAAPAEAAPSWPAAAPGDLAYVIFTSGSTGVPKGVMIEHRAALNTILDVNQRFAVTAQDRVLGLSSLGFDLSVWDIFGTLAAGAALVLPEPAAGRDPSRWAALAARHGVTVWNSVPALAEMLVEHLAGAAAPRLERLRLALLSGDWIPVDLPRRLQRAAPAARVVSLGGATEAAIWSIAFPIAEVDPAWTSIPYGKPLGGQRFAVLDQRLGRRPVWVTGEIYIAGAGLARGYWRDPERTAASFFVHPESGERLYRTGDLGRYLPDGNIEFLGREDAQVKVLGHRIELGEIEAALARHPRVKAAAVAAAGRERSRTSLVAYLVPADPAAAAGTDVRPSAEEIASLQWKLEERGVRRDLAGRPALTLPAVLLDAPRRQAYERRRSHREFLPEPVAAAAVLALLARARREPGWDAAEAGGGEELEVYLAVRAGRVAGLAAGVYRCHAGGLPLLEALHPGAELPREAYGAPNRPIFDQAAFSLLLVAPDRTAGGAPAARRGALLAAGRLGQRLMSMAPGLGLGLCPIGALAPAPVRSLFQRTGGAWLAHSLLGGAIAPLEPVAVASPQHAAVAPLGDAAAAAPPADLAELLAALVQVRLPAFPLPKYRYPSAGSLYPVQCYLLAPPDAVAALEGGAYYHHPRDHRLVRLADWPVAAAGQPVPPPALLLVGELAAIEPVYAEAAADFCLLEAGYMCELLASQAPAFGLVLRPVAGDAAGPAAGPRAAAGELRRLLALEREPLVLCRLEVTPRQPSVVTLGDRRAIAAAPAGSPRPLAAAPAGDLVAELREHLRQVLPSHMVPGSFVLLPALPLTANGKVDRHALPAAARPVAPALGAEPPATALERELAGIFQEVLGTPAVGVHESFFDLGGSSVHLVQAHVQLQARLGREVPLLEMFNHPTVSRLAAFLGQESGLAAAAPFALGEERVAQVLGGQRLRKLRLAGREEAPDAG
jgi:amino acid adenylation domain-containing protein